MGDKAIRGNRLTKGPHGHGYKPQLSTHAKGGRAGYFGGGRTNLLEELGRVEAEPSNRNRRAEISRVHGELNRGYAKGGKVDKKWIQKAVNPKHKGYCTPMTKKTCTPARKALARPFKKKAKTGWG